MNNLSWTNGIPKEGVQLVNGPNIMNSKKKLNYVD